MLHAALLWTGLLAALPGDAHPSPQDLKTYDALEHKAGRDAPAQVKLALWCEAHGLETQRREHLAQAVQADPGNATARGLLGQVRFEGRWEAPAQVGERLRADERRAARLADYRRRRERVDQDEDYLRSLLKREEVGTGFAPGTLDDRVMKSFDRSLQREVRHRLAQQHANLAMWCLENGLEPEATAHFTAAVHHDPAREASWRHLGYVRRRGRWLTREQADAEEDDERECQIADRRWRPSLRRWKRALGGSASQRARAERQLAAVTDPHAIPALIEVFATPSEDDQSRLIGMLERIDVPRSSRALANLATGSSSALVRTAAIEVLRKRPRRDYAGSLVEAIRDRIEYTVRPVEGPGSRGALILDTPRLRVVRAYDAPPPFDLSSLFSGYIGYDANGLPIVVEGVELGLMGLETNPFRLQADIQTLERRTAAMVAGANLAAKLAQDWLARDIEGVERLNARSEAINERIIPVLRLAAGAPADLEGNSDAWHVWWYDTLGYRYEPPARETVFRDSPVVYSPPHITTCFAAGTPVRTLDGPRPIESIRVGDQVLGQDERSGALAFQPVVFVHHNPPGKTLRVSFAGGTSVVCSVYHRFWRAYLGWAMARELKPGDVLRTLGGRVRVEKVEPDDSQPLYNLDVARARTFFAGTDHLLVHDNTLPDHRLEPFDALPVVEVARPE